MNQMILLLNYQIVDEGQTYMNTPYWGVVKYYVGTDMFGWGQSTSTTKSENG